MKKLIILLIILILGASLMVFAQGAQKLVFVPDEDNSPVGTDHENLNGFVILNETPDGATTTTIQIQIRDAAPGELYEVISASKLLGTILTDKKGKGKLHCNLPLDEFADESALGGAINIFFDGTRYFRAKMIP